MVGDWVVYYEPRRDAGRLAYFAAARVASIDPDVRSDQHFYAVIEDYLEFDNPVPLRRADAGFCESRLGAIGSNPNSGIMQRSVRFIEDLEFDNIVRAGFAADIVPDWERVGLAEDAAIFERPMQQLLTSRPFRDRAFSARVRGAYDLTCAVTGLRIVNGGGRPEVDAAHIRPVGDDHGGPDTVRNGLALSKTVHWTFDRGLLSLEDDGKLLVTKQLQDSPIARLLNVDGYARIPKSNALRPHPSFLRYHRETIFKG